MIQLNKHLISKTFQKTKTKVFMFAGLSELLQQHVQEWNIDPNGKKVPDEAIITPKSLGVNAIAEAIVKAGILEKAVLPFPFRQDVRYLFGKVDLLELVQSLSGEGYFTHFTAIHLNNLTEQAPKTIYFNVEQRTDGRNGAIDARVAESRLQGPASPLLKRGRVQRHANCQGKRPKHQSTRGCRKASCECRNSEGDGL